MASDVRLEHVSKSFGTFKAVRIPPGTHVVRFEYAPFSR